MVNLSASRLWRIASSGSGAVWWACTWMSSVTYMYESCHVAYVKCHVAHVDESCRTRQCVMSCMWMSHVTHVDVLPRTPLLFFDIAACAHFLWALVRALSLSLARIFASVLLFIVGRQERERASARERESERQRDRARGNRQRRGSWGKGGWVLDFPHTYQQPHPLCLWADLWEGSFWGRGGDNACLNYTIWAQICVGNTILQTTGGVEICATCLIHARDMSRSCVWHDSFIPIEPAASGGSHTQIHTCAYIYTYICVHIHPHIYMCAYIHTYICKCVYIYIYIHTYIYICIYTCEAAPIHIHICIHICTSILLCFGPCTNTVHFWHDLRDKPYHFSFDYSFIW